MRVAADIVPIQLSLTEGDLVTLWAPRWREDGEEWEAFLGDDDALFAFPEVAQLAAFVRTEDEHDLGDHPAWPVVADLTIAELTPDEAHRYDIIGVPELAAEDNDQWTVGELAEIVGMVRSIAEVCELEVVEEVLDSAAGFALLDQGTLPFVGREGARLWAQLVSTIAERWDDVIDALDELVTTPRVDMAALAAAEKEAEELAEREAEADALTSGQVVDDDGVDDRELDVDAEDDTDADEKAEVAVAAPVADDDLLRTVHDEALIRAVMRAGEDPARVDLGRGLGSEDNPTFRGMHQASAHIVGATVEAARRVWEGEALHAANITGGLHHAMPDRVSGFCVYNDVAVAIRWLLDHGAERIAYVDVDVHHGDGVEQIFYDDPRVLTISLHETGQVLFPGTGFPQDTGGSQAEGSAVNVALPPGTADAGWLRAFHAVVPPLVRSFAPQVLVTQHGCDSHVEDPLAHLALTVDGQRASYEALHDLAHEVCEGRWLATGGGGYAVVDVVPRAWSHLLAIVGGRPVAPATPVPEAWREDVVRRLGRHAPLRMTDGRDAAYSPWERGYDPETWLDRAVHATRTSVFPLHGLDPVW